MATNDDPLSTLSPAERAYLFGGQTTQQAPRASTSAPATAPPGGYSIFNPDPTGVQHAIETGMQGGLQTVLNAPSDWLRRAGFNVGDLAGPGAPINVPALTPAEQQGQQNHPVWTGVGRFAGEALGAAPAIIGGEALLPTAAAAGASPVVSAATNALANPLVRGAIMGAGQNALTSAGSPDQPLWGQMATGAAFGAGGGWLGGRIGRMFGSDATLASQGVQDAGNTAKAAGIDVLPGNLPQAGAAAAQKGAAASPGQIQQVNKAFGNLVGGNVDDFSAKSLRPLKNQVGGEVSAAVNQGQIQMTPQLETELQTVLQNAHAPGVDPLVTAKIEHEVDKVLSIAPKVGDTMTGAQYDRLVGANSKLSGYMGDKQSKDLVDLAHQLDTTLDSAFKASSPAGVYDRVVDAKTRYRLLSAIEDNVEADASGNIKPGTIMADINRRFPNMPTQTGQGTVGQASDLARAVTTLFGGGQGAPGAAAATGGFLRQHPFLGGALGAGGVGSAYQLATNPAAVGNALTWGATHLPVILPAGAAYLADRGLGRAGRAYQQSGRFANALLQRGTQPAYNPLVPALGAAAAAAPPDRR